MDDINTLWQQRLEALRGKMDSRIFNTWFRPVAVDSYDAKANTIVLRVPSEYVYEYLELYQPPALQWLLGGMLKKGWKLQYRILQNGDGRPADYRLDPQAHRTYLKVPDAERRMREELGKRGLRWLDMYQSVADWLADNRGRGLLVLGTTGTGKSTICLDILPAILQRRDITVCTAHDMPRRIDELLAAPCVVIDGLGKEDPLYFNRPHNSFYKLCDTAEHDGKLLIITTQLSTTPSRSPLFPESIDHRYGPDVTDRLRSLVLAVPFVGESLRPK